MLKKSILPIFLLAMVVVLSVFYIKKTTNDDSKEVSNSGDQTVLSTFASKRLEILDLRSVMIDKLEEEIASGSLTTLEIEAKVNEINDLYYLKYTETSLEDAICELGFKDSLVMIEDKNVSIIIIDDELTTEDFINVAGVVKTELGNGYKVNLETLKKKKKKISEDIYKRY